MMIEEHQGEFSISTSPERLDVSMIQEFLARSYWAEGIPRNIVERSIQGSICFGFYHREAQIGFARVVTDRATFAYLADVFILEAYRGRGLAKWLMSVIMQHPDLQGLRRFLLATRDAGQLYRQFGFKPLAQPERFLEIHQPGVYLQSK
jgi:GNAT superfamily N-acetyltransferase